MRMTKLTSILTACCLTFASSAMSNTLTVEELRVPSAVEAMPNMLASQTPLIKDFGQQLSSEQALDKVISEFAKKLWQNNVSLIQKQADGDDRKLYWARLSMASALRQHPRFTQLSTEEQQQLMRQFEFISRGSEDVNFDEDATIKILVTGFDPFFLDRHITQSNPSGVSALMLDGKTININNKKAHIEALMIPVRFADFDQGMIESLLTPYMKDKSVDYIFTISMGRKDFDIERFPGLRRSANAPDNLNVYTGANKSLPLIPRLYDKPLTGPEFVKFSLPVDVMKQAKTHYQVNDNKNIATLAGKMTANSLSELANKVSVSGSGGGYLSNEISYRSIVLRNEFNPSLPVGHIHTPRIAAFEPETSNRIYQDILLMLEEVVSQH